ncbi:hypothetical protein PHYSODRAFT_508379, partial [Phytophthora sojae]
SLSLTSTPAMSTVCLVAATDAAEIALLSLTTLMKPELMPPRMSATGSSTTVL